MMCGYNLTINCINVKDFLRKETKTFRVFQFCSQDTRRDSGSSTQHSGGSSYYCCQEPDCRVARQPGYPPPPVSTFKRQKCLRYKRDRPILRSKVINSNCLIRLTFNSKLILVGYKWPILETARTSDESLGAVFRALGAHFGQLRGNVERQRPLLGQSRVLFGRFHRGLVQAAGQRRLLPAADLQKQRAPFDRGTQRSHHQMAVQLPKITTHIRLKRKLLIS